MRLTWPLDVAWGLLMRHLHLDYDIADTLPSPDYLAGAVIQEPWVA